MRCKWIIPLRQTALERDGLRDAATNRNWGHLSARDFPQCAHFPFFVADVLRLAHVLYSRRRPNQIPTPTPESFSQSEATLRGAGLFPLPPSG
jgi:hypothetical protein